MSDDIVTDMLDRVQSLLGPDALSNDAALKIEAEIRRDWGGDRPYIGKTKFDVDARNQRDRRIWIDHCRGEHVPLLARRYRISTRQVRRILAAQRDLARGERVTRLP